MIDVLEEIKPLLVFESEDDFYMLQLTQRKKDNPQIGSNSRVFKTYRIPNVEYLEKRYEEIKTLCTVLNARAMLRLNKRSYKKIAYKNLHQVADLISQGMHQQVSAAYDHMCGRNHNDKVKKWIVDIDSIDGEKVSQIRVNNVIEAINSCMPEGDKILIQLPTKNGVHLVTRPFNVAEYKTFELEADIHRDNPINLFIP